MAKKTLVAIFFFLLPWQTRWIIAPAASEYATVAVTVIEVIFWLVLISSLRGVRRRSNLIWFFLIFAALSIFWTSDRTAGLAALIHLVEGALLFIIVRSDDKLRELSVRAFLYGMLPSAALGIYQFLTQHIAGSTLLGIAPHDAWMAGASVIETPLGRTLRAYGPFPHPNIFGGYLVVAILLSLRAQRSNLIRSALIPIFSAALVATFSRSAWVALAVGLVVWIVRQRRISLRLTSSIFLSILAPFLISFFLVPDLFRARLSATGRLEARSTIERTTSLREGFDDFASNPIFGNGLGQTSVEPPHNFFLALAADLGLIGLLLFILVIARILTTKKFHPILFALLALTLFDHYLWTLLPGVWLFWLVLTVRED